MTAIDLSDSLADPVTTEEIAEATKPEPGNVVHVVIHNDDHDATRARLLLGALVYDALRDAGLPIRLERLLQIGFDTAEVKAIEKAKAKRARENPEPDWHNEPHTEEKR